MTFAPPPAAPGPSPRPARPTVVTAACVVMFGMAAIAVLRQVISVAMSLDRITLDGIAFALLMLVPAGVLAVLAYYTLQGANNARIGAWCLLGFMVLGGVCAVRSFGLAPEASTSPASRWP